MQARVFSTSNGSGIIAENTGTDQQEIHVLVREGEMSRKLKTVGVERSRGQAREGRRDSGIRDSHSVTHGQWHGCLCCRSLRGTLCPPPPPTYTHISRARPVKYGDSLFASMGKNKQPSPDERATNGGLQHHALAGRLEHRYMNN